MTGEADVAGFVRDAFRDDLVASEIDLVEIGFEDARAVERDLDLIAADFDLFVVPLAWGAEEAGLRADEVIDAAVVLVVFQLLAGMGLVVAVVVDDLDFEAVGGAVTTERCAQSDAVVAVLRDLHFKADDAVGVFFLGEQIAAFALFADDGAVDDFVVGHRALPVAEIDAVVEAGEAFFGPVAAERGVCLVGRDFADEDIAPADLAAVGLELDGAFGVGRISDPVRRRRGGSGFFVILLAVGEVAGLAVREEVLQHGILHDDFAIEGDRGAFADHFDVEGVPLTDGLIHELERILTFDAFVVPEAAGAVLLAQRERFLVFFGEVPDLHLRDAAQVDTAVAQRQHFVIHHELKVAVVLVGGEVEAFAVVHELAVLDFPVRVDVVALVVALCILQAAFDGLLFVGGELLGRHLPEVHGILRAPAIPAGEILAIKESGEAGRRSIVFRKSGQRGRGEGEEQGWQCFHGMVREAVDESVPIARIFQARRKEERGSFPLDTSGTRVDFPRA